MVRATAANAQIRAFACTTRETVETARASHNTSPVVTAALGRLLSAGAMMGSMLKGDDELITLQIKGDGPIGGLTVTADMNGHVKGYANVPDVILPANAQGKLDVGGAVGAGALSVIRDMGFSKRLFTSLVAFCMLFAVSAVPAFAAETTTEITDTQHIQKVVVMC